MRSGPMPAGANAAVNSRSAAGSATSAPQAAWRQWLRSSSARWWGAVRRTIMS